MLGKKIILNDRIRNYIIDFRKNAMKSNKLLTADYISEQIGRSKSWLSQVENGRLKSVKTNDLVNVFCLLQDINPNSENDRKKVIALLDDQIMYIRTTEQLGLIDANGNAIDLAELLSFNQVRGYLQFAGRNILKHFYKILNCDLSNLQKILESEMRHILSDIVQWFNRAFNDASGLFSDEISARNLFFIMDTSIKLYNGNCDYYGLNPLDIPESDVLLLKKNLDIDFFLKAKTIIKPLNEYTSLEYDDVVKNFSTEEFMTWKNKHTYIGDDPFPMIVNFLSSSSDNNHFEYYEDLNHATGLSEDKYLYIIKQVYTQFDDIYKRYKTLLHSYDDLEAENDELYLQNKQLKGEQ